MKLKIEKWDPATMLKPHRKILYIGASGKGKSVAMRAILATLLCVALPVALSGRDMIGRDLPRLAEISRDPLRFALPGRDTIGIAATCGGETAARRRRDPRVYPR